MKAFFMLLFGLVICGLSLHAQVSFVKVPNRFSNHMEILDSTTIMIPLAWTSWSKVNNLKIEFSGDFDYRNIYFYNYVKDSTTVLFTDSMQLIALRYETVDIETSRQRSKNYFYNGYLLYDVINTDFNKDGKLDTTDPVYLFASDSHGANVKRITPENYSVEEINYFKDLGFILARLKEDSNNDGRFNSNDREIIYRIELIDFSRSKFVEGLIVPYGK